MSTKLLNVEKKMFIQFFIIFFLKENNKNKNKKLFFIKSKFGALGLSRCCSWLYFCINFGDYSLGRYTYLYQLIHFTAITAAGVLCRPVTATDFKYTVTFEDRCEKAEVKIESTKLMLGTPQHIFTHKCKPRE